MKPPQRESSLASRGIVLLLLLWCGLLFFVGLHSGTLYQTESLRAILAAEFLRSGNWIIPTLYGDPLLTKPPGMYALIALASRPFGEVSTATARLPSALAATATVLLFYSVFARRLGKRAGLLVAAVLPASVLWLQRAPSAEIDLIQLAWVAAALVCFLRALEVIETPQRSRFAAEWLWWQAALLCVAGGLLTKWTAPAFFYLTIVPLLWRRGRLCDLLRPAHIVSMVVAALPCLAWAAAATVQVGWQPLLDAVRQEALPRLSPAHHTRPYPWHELLLFPAEFLAANLPWSAAALWTLTPGFARLWDERGRRLLQLLHCWTWPNLLFWSVVPGHHLRHALPLQPGLAGLAVLVWIAWLDGRLRWPLPVLRPRAVLLTLLACWLAVKLVFVGLIVPARDAHRTPRATAEQIAAVVPPDQMLYLFGLKDEGVLFYYGRPARRLPAPSFLPPSRNDVYCLLIESEWRACLGSPGVQLLLALHDQQGKPFFLVRWGPQQPVAGAPGL